MSSPPPPTPPGERRLDRPPSDRYRDPATEPADPGTMSGRGPSAGRAVAVAGLAGLAGALAIVLLGGLLGMSAGLLVIAGATGWAIGTALRSLAGPTMARPGRNGLAVAITVVAIVLGQVGLWWYARTEGGVLGPADYLGATFGPLVPAQLVLGIALAWWAAR